MRKHESLCERVWADGVQWEGARETLGRRELIESQEPGLFLFPTPIFLRFIAHVDLSACHVLLPWCCRAALCCLSCSQKALYKCFENFLSQEIPSFSL